MPGVGGDDMAELGEVRSGTSAEVGCDCCWGVCLTCWCWMACAWLMSGRA